KRPKLRDVPGFVDACLRDAVLGNLAFAAGTFGDPGLMASDRRSGRNVVKIFFDLLAHDVRLDIARDDDGGVRRAVVGLEPLLHVVDGSGVQVFHRADNGPRVWVAWRVSGFGYEFMYEAVRLVLALPFLVLDDAALLVELGLIDRADKMAHAVR